MQESVRKLAEEKGTGVNDEFYDENDVPKMSILDDEKKETEKKVIRTESFSSSTYTVNGQQVSKAEYLAHKEDPFGDKAAAEFKAFEADIEAAYQKQLLADEKAKKQKESDARSDIHSNRNQAPINNTSAQDKTALQRTLAQNERNAFLARLITQQQMMLVLILM